LAKEDEWWRGCQTCNVIFFPVAVEVALAAGSLDQARLLQERLEKGIKGWDAGPWQAAALRTRGLLHLAEGRSDEAVADLEQARTVITQKDQPYDLAHTLYHLGDAYLRRDKDDDKAKSREALEGALRIFRQLRAVKDIERAQALVAQLS
jgi:tetratricopeptide (TPR) repeat protein